ncbi:MAG TPA: D-alanine--D-alanine ligase [Tepidisphaeraceae bacterium]|nr:D-alanine--D-alanine ligase [Tepidisphaeraceae bacterium]
MKVTVLYGGPSAEREISLVSGKAVIDGLRAAGHDVFPSDISPADLKGLDHPADVIFPVLHGQFGESGELQEILEARKLSFVGSGSKASHVGINKVETKRVWEKAGLPTPQYVIVNRQNIGSAGMQAPAVVKAFGSGSSIDVYICKSADDLAEKIKLVVDKHGEALVEQYIKGPELTVGILEEKALAPIRIVPKAEFFDYNAKYKAADTEHRFDTGLPPQLVKECQDLAERANNVLGARDLARIDIMIDEKTHRPYLLEINTLPGFTPKSLLPEAAAHAGIPFNQLVDRLVKRAHKRGAM